MVWCTTGRLHSAEVFDGEGAARLFLLQRVKDPAAILRTETCDFDAAVRELARIRTGILGQLGKIVRAVCGREVNRESN